MDVDLSFLDINLLELGFWVVGIAVKDSGSNQVGEVAPNSASVVGLGLGVILLGLLFSAVFDGFKTSSKNSWTFHFLYCIISNRFGPLSV